MKEQVELDENDGNGGARSRQVELDGNGGARSR